MSPKSTMPATVKSRVRSNPGGRRGGHAQMLPKVLSFRVADDFEAMGPL